MPKFEQVPVCMTCGKLKDWDEVKVLSSGIECIRCYNKRHQLAPFMRYTKMDQGKKLAFGGLALLSAAQIARLLLFRRSNPST